jgi:hypothetical protein
MELVYLAHNQIAALALLKNATDACQNTFIKMVNVLPHHLLAMLNIVTYAKLLIKIIAKFVLLIIN